MTYYVQSISALLSAPLDLALEAPGATRPELSSLGIIDDRLRTRYTDPGATVEIGDWWLA